MINEVLDQLTYLKLKSAHAYLKELHINDNISSSEIKVLNKVLSKEVEAKEENNWLYNVKVSEFPFIRKLEDYNVVFIGNPGVGKTYLVVAIGYEVEIKRNSVYFIKFSKLINNLKQAYNEGVLEKK